MCEVKDLNPDYEYDYSIKKSLIGTLSSESFNKKNPFQMVSFINEFVTTNEWEWDSSCFRHYQKIIQKNRLKPLKTLHFDFYCGCPCCILEDVCSQETK